jgi:hypothetical protein
MITALSVEFDTVGWPDHNIAKTQETLKNWNSPCTGSKRYEIQEW